jgi:hypothetical protein
LIEHDAADDHWDAENGEESEEPEHGHGGGGEEFSEKNFEWAEIGEKEQAQGAFAFFAGEGVECFEGASDGCIKKTHRAKRLEKRRAGGVDVGSKYAAECDDSEKAGDDETDRVGKSFARGDAGFACGDWKEITSEGLRGC